MARNTNRKKTLTYYFSVEGSTEKWYLDWLENLINSIDEAKYKVKIKAEVQKDPVSYGKKLTVREKTIVWHISDIEGTSREHIQAPQADQRSHNPWDAERYSPACASCGT